MINDSIAAMMFGVINGYDTPIHPNLNKDIKYYKFIFV